MLTKLQREMQQNKSKVSENGYGESMYPEHHFKWSGVKEQV